MRALLVALVAARINAQCPSPYEGTSTDACFLISDFPATFSQCQQHCESNGGSLATIKSKEEDDYVRQLVTTQRAVWIGLFESGEQDESGVWEWVNGMSDTWRNWHSAVWKSTSATGARQFFTKSFLGDDVVALAPSSGEEPASPRHRAGVASMACRSTR
jgi:hypothetical protein